MLIRNKSAHLTPIMYIDLDGLEGTFPGTVPSSGMIKLINWKELGSKIKDHATAIENWMTGKVPADHKVTSKLPSGNDGRKDDGSKVNGSPGIGATKGTTHILITEFLISPGIRTAAPIGPLVTAAGKFSNEAAKNAAEMVDMTVDGVQNLIPPSSAAPEPKDATQIKKDTVPIPSEGPTEYNGNRYIDKEVVTKKGEKVIKRDTVPTPLPSH